MLCEATCIAVGPLDHLPVLRCNSAPAPVIARQTDRNQRTVPKHNV